MNKKSYWLSISMFVLILIWTVYYLSLIHIYAIVKVTLASICSSDLHIKHGSVPRAVPGITVGHEMVGVVEEVGRAVTNVKPGDRVTCLLYTSRAKKQPAISGQDSQRR